jgi:hypothetical protein
VAANHEQSGQSTPAWIESQAVPVLAARTHETSQPVLVYNVQTDTIASTWRDMALSDGIASVLAVPFQVKQTGNASSGVLLVFSVEADTFDKESIGMVQNLSDNLAYGMHIIRTTHLQREGP